MLMDNLVRFRENIIKKRRRFNIQFYWLLILTLSFIIVISVIRTINKFLDTYEVQRFNDGGGEYGSTIILYNNCYFSFDYVNEENQLRFTNGKWELNGDTLILNLVGSFKDFTGKDHLFPVFRNAKYLISNDCIVLDKTDDNSYKVLYPYNKYWVNNIQAFWEYKERMKLY
jgi:hypothetical protein